jgi:hypothetical protein
VEMRAENVFQSSAAIALNKGVSCACKRRIRPKIQENASLGLNRTKSFSSALNTLTWSCPWIDALLRFFFTSNHVSTVVPSGKSLMLTATMPMWSSARKRSQRRPKRNLQAASRYLLKHHLYHIYRIKAHCYRQLSPCKRKSTSRDVSEDNGG